MLYFIFAASVAAAYKPTATKPWPSRAPRAKWPSPTEEWGTPPTEFPADDSGSGFKFTLPIIMGIVVGCLVFIILIILLVILIIRKRKQKGSVLMGEDSKVQAADINEELMK